MAIQEYSPLEQPEQVEVTIWPVKVGDHNLNLMRGHTTEYYVSLGERAVGLLHWSAGSEEAFIDGIDTDEGVTEDSITIYEWDAIADSMRALADYAKVRRITHPLGTKVYLESI